MSSILRINTVVEKLKYKYLFDKDMVITSVFKITREGTSCIYAYLYSEIVNKQIEHRFFTFGPTYKSLDGEYRSRMVPISHITLFKNSYPNVYDYVEEFIVQKLDSDAIEFSVEILYPDNNLFDESEFGRSINESRFAIKFFMFCWVFDYYNIHNKIMENHMNPAYQWCVYNTNDLNLYNTVTDYFGGIDIYINALYKLSSYDMKSTDKTAKLIVGQKIMPLTYNEILYVGNIIFPVWREIWISSYCSDLLINFISPSFPVYNNWFFIQNSYAGIYDNISMHKKYENSKVGFEINNQLTTVDKLNFINNDMREGYIDGKFGKLSSKIRKAITYNESNIKLTKLSLMVHSEYVGRTLRDSIQLAKNKYMSTSYKQIHEDPKLFAKLIFEFIYAIYCMNTRLGFIHGDLHLNNCTLHKYVRVNEGIGKLDKPTIIYNTEDATYAFPHRGIFAMLIDFSRGIVENRDLIARDFGTIFLEQFMKEQRIRYMKIIQHYLPKFTEKYADNLLALATENPSLMFKITTSIDIFSICKNYAGLYEAEMSSDIKDEPWMRPLDLHKDNLLLLKQIATSAENLLLTTFKRVFDKKITHAEEIDYPCNIIMKEYFSGFIIRRTSSAMRIDPRHRNNSANMIFHNKSVNNLHLSNYARSARSVQSAHSAHSAHSAQSARSAQSAQSAHTAHTAQSAHSIHYTKQNAKDKKSEYGIKTYEQTGINVPKEENMNVLDVFNQMSDLEYNLRNYYKFPPYIDIDEKLRIMKKHKINTDMNYYNKIKDDIEKIENLDIIDEIVNKHTDSSIKIEDESSWIYD